MQCLHASELMSLRLDGLIGEDEKLQLRRHLASCAACTSQWERMRQIERLFAHAAPAPPPAQFQARVMFAVQRREQLVSLRRVFYFFLSSAVLMVIICAVPVLLAAGHIAANPSLVQSIVSVLIRVADIGYAMAGALELVLRTLVGGMNWILVPGAIALVVGMMMVWWSLVSLPTRLAWRRVHEQA